MWVVYVTQTEPKGTRLPLESRAFRNLCPATTTLVGVTNIWDSKIYSLVFSDVCLREHTQLNVSGYISWRRKSVFSIEEVIDRAEAEASGSDAASAPSEFRCTTRQV